ncbi:MAG TPA: AcrB/AcrD/AcrF family protein [Allosphingosinicella sp.]
MKLAEAFERHWRPLVLLFWLGTAIYLVWDRWGGINSFALGDTDDNLRIMQVRGWLIEGQGWYDLRQYRLSPPEGLNIHWSRLVDLPIAALYLLLTPLMGGAPAERWAVAIAPMLPLLIAMGAMALTARRLLSPYAFWLALALIICGGSVLSMFAPLRIDHHGWQLAMVAVAVAGLADPRKARGGVTLGVASALSLVIGLEMLLYLAVAGVSVGLFWVRDPAEARRLAAYGVSFAGASALGFLIFGSNDNWSAMCDALSPVWLSVVLLAGAVAVVLAWLSPKSLLLRLGAAAIGGAAVAAMYALLWPDCLGRLERVPEELDRFWLTNVREAMPVYRHGLATTVAIATLPVIGLVGYILMLWRTRRDPDLFPRWAALGYCAALALFLLLWQTRAAAASQLLAVPGAAALGWVLIQWFQRQKHMIVRVLGTGAAFLLVSGAILSEAGGWLEEDEPMTPAREAINNANWRCPQGKFLHPVAQQPRGRILTFVDMGPRLVTLTHHDAIAGPYHRNAQAILDVMRAFRGDAANAREIIDRRGIDYVLICPNMSESTIYRADTPEGWYAQLSKGQVPEWLEPVQLPGDSPFRMWRVRR